MSEQITFIDAAEVRVWREVLLIEIDAGAEPVNAASIADITVLERRKRIGPKPQPEATTLGECKPFDVIDLYGTERAMVYVDEDGYIGVIFEDGTVDCPVNDTPVLLVARVQLQGRGK